LGTLELKVERQSAQMSKIRNGRLDQHGAGFFEWQQFGTTGVELEGLIEYGTTLLFIFATVINFNIF